MLQAEWIVSMILPKLAVTSSSYRRAAYLIAGLVCGISLTTGFAGARSDVNEAADQAYEADENAVLHALLAESGLGLFDENTCISTTLLAQTTNPKVYLPYLPRTEGIRREEAQNRRVYSSTLKSLVKRFRPLPKRLVKYRSMSNDNVTFDSVSPANCARVAKVGLHRPMIRNNKAIIEAGAGWICGNSSFAFVMERRKGAWKYRSTEPHGMTVGPPACAHYHKDDKVDLTTGWFRVLKR